MKRNAGALVLLAALGGCVSMDQGPSSGGGGCRSCGGWGGGSWGGGGSGGGPPSVPGVQGGWGQPVAMAAPYSMVPPGEAAAREMMARSVPLDLMQAGATMTPGGPSGIIRAGGPGMAPPPGSLQAPGMPYQPFTPGLSTPPPGAVAAVGALTAPSQSPFPTKRTEVSFVDPKGMHVAWLAPTSDGRAGFGGGHVDVPGRYNFAQGAIYRLKLTDIPGRPGVELYPTLEVVPSNLKTDSFLAHSSVPVAFTQEDLDQVLVGGNYVVKVIYLPDPQFQDFAVAGPDEVVSSRLEPGADPIAEAYRRGSILLVVRLGNIDLELNHSPGMETPSQYGPKQQNQGMPGCPVPPAGMMGGQPMMMMGPNGPVMMGPNGPMPMTGAPAMQPAPMLPPFGGGMPALPASRQPMTMPTLPAVGQPMAAPTFGPVSKLPDPSAVETTQYKNATTNTTTPAQLAGQSSNAADSKATEKKSPSRSWWWPGSEK